MYSDDKNAQIVLALLKRYGIKKIVVSPGMTNVPISRSVQIDPWFEVYSVVDERSAAYFATGLAYESGEPVVISCTGATASRNYLPGLTEAYYRNLPVIALTSQRQTSDYGNLVPQITDRTISQNDVKRVSVHLPIVRTEEDAERCEISVNKALIEATTRGSGPVHINLPVEKLSFTTEKLPEPRKIDYYSIELAREQIKSLQSELNGKKIAVFIGAHAKMSEKLHESIKKFAYTYKASVLVDQTSGYQSDNAILLAQISDLKKSTNRPDIIIDIGSITGEYSANWLWGVETWRISEDGRIHDRFHKQTKLFDGSERYFFEALVFGVSRNKCDYHSQLMAELGSITVPELPFSNTYISYELSKRLPHDSTLHMGILNSLRNMNFFNVDETVQGVSNVGGFGIDGPISTLVGQSMVNPNKITFGLIGDLAAFYDMNALGIRHIKNNIRILIVNNNGGVEFRLNDEIESQLAEDTNEFISARGHHGSMKAWAQDMGFHYISAKSKEDFLSLIDSFCSPSLDTFNQPVIFEVFTTMKGEQDGVRALHDANDPKNDSNVDRQASRATNLAKKVYRKIKRD